LEYRNLGRTGKKVSLLSLGCMRLPEDDEEGAQVVSRAVDLGINYFETSEWYCDNRSEIKVGMGIKGRRDKVYISTKTKVNPDTTGDAVKRAFEGSLDRLGVDRVEFYQIWDFRWPEKDAVLEKGGALDVLEKLRDEGLIGHIGITSHESNEHITEMLNTGRAESVTLSYNMLNRTVEPVIRYAAERGIGVVIMTPLAGGLLVTPSDVLSELLPGRSASRAAMALTFVMSNPWVSTVPSGMTSVAEVEENVRTWAEFEPFAPEELDQAVRALDD
jgi:predicted aldo/keto reductase-like oxidoreductase